MGESSFSFQCPSFVCVAGGWLNYFGSHIRLESELLQGKIFQGKNLLLPVLGSTWHSINVKWKEERKKEGGKEGEREERRKGGRTNSQWVFCSLIKVLKGPVGIKGHHIFS